MMQEIDVLLLGFQKVSTNSKKNIQFPEGIRCCYTRGQHVLFLDKKQNLFLCRDNEYIKVSSLQELRFLKNDTLPISQKSG